MLTHPHPLGWHRPESLGRAPHAGHLLATASDLAALPPSVLLEGLPEVYDQGTVGSCTAQALSGAVEVLHARGGYPAERPDRMALYYRERVAIGLPGEDSGAILADGIDALRRGYEPEREASLLWGPEWTDAPPAQGPDAPRLVSAEPLAPDVATVCWEIASGHPVVVGLSITEAWFACAGELPPPSGGSSVGGHAVMLVGYDLARRAFRLRNSWGSGWGEDGYAWLPFAWLSLPWCGEAHSLRAVRRAMLTALGFGEAKAEMLGALEGGLPR